MWRLLALVGSKSMVGVQILEQTDLDSIALPLMLMEEPLFGMAFVVA